MKFKSIIVLVFVVLFFNGFIFGDPKIDTTTDEKMKESIQKVEKSLKEDQKKEFQESVKFLMFSNLDMKSLFANALAGKKVDQEQLANDMKKSLHGLTGEEVIALAKEKMEIQKAKAKKAAEEKAKYQKEMDLKELEDLKNKKSLYKENKESLNKFKVVSSKFYKYKKNKYSSYLTPVIDIKIKNTSEHPISRVYCKGTIKSPERSVPWLVEDFNFKISGGLEPNETRDWQLTPNPFSEWGKVNSPEEAIFEVEILEVDGADNKTLYTIMNFTEKDQEKLQELERKYK